MSRLKKYMITVAVACVSVITLTGCKSSGELTAAAMESVRNLDYRNALTQFEEARAAGENERQISRGMGIAYMGLTDYVQASACFEDALKKSNGLLENMDYDLNYYLASSYTKENRLSEAESTYNAILTMKPEEVDAYFLRGNVRVGLGKTKEALEDFDKVATMEPQNYDRLKSITAARKK